MREKLKIVVIGGGSSYTPEIIEGFISQHKHLPVGEIWLVDIPQGEHKLNIVGNLAKRMVGKSGLPIEVHLTLDRREALKGADFVSTQMRVGLLEARIWDETIPLKYGVIGQETTGPGGMMKALRTIPALIGIAGDMEELCPDAWLLNFTNPAGMVTEAVMKYSSIKTIGLCNAPIGMQKWLMKTYQVAAEKIYTEFVGLNHLHWITQVRVNGESKLEELLDDREGYSAKNVEQMSWNPAFIRSLGAIPSYYLKYYYLTDEMLKEQIASSKEQGTRAQVVKQVEDELFELYKDPDLKEKPKQLEKRGGAYYSEAAVNLMKSLFNVTKDIQTVNVRNGKTLDFLPEDSCIEVNCIITGQGPIPLSVSHVPEATKGLIQAVKSYEILTIEAAVTGDKGTALQALAHHPLITSVNTAEKLLDEMLEHNKLYLPKFFN
ncbi:6-phospho-beta-glucosidase [Paenibacillus larvae]